MDRLIKSCEVMGNGGANGEAGGRLGREGEGLQEGENNRVKKSTHGEKNRAGAREEKNAGNGVEKHTKVTATQVAGGEAKEGEGRGRSTCERSMECKGGYFGGG